MKRIFCILALIAPAVQATPTNLYNVDFEAPVHIAGNAPATGPGSTTPTAITFGQPLVSSGFGVMPGQSLVFNTSGNTPLFFYDQIRLDINQSATSYQVAFQAASQGFVNTGSVNLFRLLFDTTDGVQSLDFYNNGQIRAFAGGANPLVGSHADNSLLDVLVYIDLIAANWSISLNGSSAHSGAFASSGAGLLSMRYSFGSNTSNSSTTFDSFGLDNVSLIAGPLPAPGGIALLMLGLGMLCRKLGTRRLKQLATN